jgi:hypothetical protein
MRDDMSQAWWTSRAAAAHWPARPRARESEAAAAAQDSRTLRRHGLGNTPAV